LNNLIEVISRDLVIPEIEIEAAIRQAHSRCRLLRIPKRNNRGFRIVSQPAAQLKPILSWVNLQILSKLPVSAIATAFHSGSSTLLNASKHKDSLYSVRIDIKDFFPSIRHTDLYKTINRQSSNLPPFACTYETMSLIGNICFDDNYSLPIGYSTSPTIANAVMFELDSQLVELTKNEAIFGKSKITRYADDFIFSTDRKGACRAFVSEFEALLNKADSPKLKINQEKTRFMSRGGGSTLITGLRVNNSGGVVVHPEYRDHVRLLLKLYKENRLGQEETQKLIGHLAYVQHVDPGFFTRLSFKFDLEIQRIRQPGKSDA
jgi:RNA-directed DNA polymerase